MIFQKIEINFQMIFFSVKFFVPLTYEAAVSDNAYKDFFSGVVTQPTVHKYTYLLLSPFTCPSLSMVINAATQPIMHSL